MIILLPVRSRRKIEEILNSETGLRNCRTCGEALPVDCFKKRWRNSRNTIEYDASCSKCDNKRIRKYRSRTGKWWNQKHSIKTAARHFTNNRIASRKLIKPESCSVCGRPSKTRDVHGHHSDYSHPENIEWLCRSCHSERHKRTGQLQLKRPGHAAVPGGTEPTL